MNLLIRISNKVRREVKKIRREVKEKWRVVKNVAGPLRRCNVCNYDFKGSFDPIPSYYIEHANRTGYLYSIDDAETLNYSEYACPRCACSDRDRLYVLYLNKTIDPGKSYDLLDIAPANALRKHLSGRRHFSYRSADLYMKGVDDNVDLMDMNIYNNNQFDIFICSHVLEHVIDDRRAMSELYRVTKPGGFGIAMVPIITTLTQIDEDVSVIDPDERWRRFGQGDHVRMYSKHGFVQRLTEAGFKVKQLSVEDFSEVEFILHGISPKSVLYIVHK